MFGGSGGMVVAEERRLFCWVTNIQQDSGGYGVDKAD